MLTHEQLVCLQKFIETQTLRYIQRLFADIESYLNTPQMQKNSKGHSCNQDLQDAQMQCIRSIFGQVSLNEQSHSSGFPLCHDNEQSQLSGFPLSHDNEQSQLSGFPLSHDNEQSHSSGFSLCHDNEQSHSSGFPLCHDNEQSHSSGFPLCHEDAQSQALNSTHCHEQMNVCPAPCPSVHENDSLNQAIASLPTMYSNGHSFPQYYIERLKLTLQIIYARPGIVRKELAVALQVSERTVSNLCSFLLKHHKIVLKDNRAGRWYPPLP